MKKLEKGITLIALVITIIVLLILAGITINLIMGEHGILNMAKKSGEEYQKASIKEELELAIMDIQMNNITITMKDIINELPIKCEGVEWIDIESDGPIGEYRGYEFKVKNNYEVEIIGKARGGRPEITDVVIETEGNPVEKVSITLKVTPQGEKTITSVIEEKSNESLNNNGDGTYTLNNITENGIYIIKATDSDGKVGIKNIEINEFKVRVTVEAGENGAVEGLGEYKVGEKVELKATANQDFKFEGWYIGDTKISEENPYQYEVKKEITITARFEFDGILISKITFKEENVKLGKDTTSGLQLEYTIEPENATNKNVLWEVDDPTLLTITNGKIVAKGKEGTAKITCKAQYGDAKAECTVQIIDGAFIYTPEDLINNFAASKKNANGEIFDDYYIMNDLDMTGYTYTTRYVYFCGTLDGGGHTISNLKIQSNDVTKCTGLVSRFDGTAEDILFKNVEVIGGSYYRAGVLGGSGNEATVRRIGITGKVSGIGKIGSFFGECYGTNSFTDCYARTTLTGSSGYDQGGLVGGSSSACSYTNCYYSGKMNATKRVGTFQAAANNDNSGNKAKLKNCYYNSSLFTLTVSTPGNPLVTADFRNKDKFVGWDFENTWYIDEETGFPELKFD